MSDVTKVIEVSSASKTSVEDAVQKGLKRVSKTVKNIKGAWINETKVITENDGTISEWRVNMRVSFLVD